MLALLPDDRNTGSTSKAQPSHCAGEVSQRWRADPMFYGSLQSNWLVFTVAFVSSPQRSGGRESEHWACCGTHCHPLVLQGMAEENVAVLALQGPPCSPFSLPAGGYHLEVPPRHQLWLSPGEEEGRALPPAWWVRSGQQTPLAPWVSSSVLKESLWKALGVQQALKICRWEEWEMWSVGLSCRQVF